MTTQFETITEDIARYPIGTVIQIGATIYRRGVNTSLEWLEVMPSGRATAWRTHADVATNVIMASGRYDVLLPAGRVIDYIEDDANWHDAEAGLVDLRQLVDDMRSGR